MAVEQFEEEIPERKTRRRKSVKEENDTGIFADLLKKEPKTRKRRTKKVEEQKNIDEGIKINAKDGVTDVFLDENEYRIEMQKTEYNIYTKNSGSSYIIVRDSEIRVISGDVYLVLHKDHQDYEIITNQDFKINYVIDNLERKDNIVNFKLTNLTEIVANEDGLNFIIDEEKVIENNLEDNKTLIISEEDGKVYLPYTKAEIKKYYLNLDTLWETDSDGKYYKQIAIDGILETDTPIIDLILSDNAETAKAEIDAWSCVSKITTNNGSIKVYCYEEKPKTQIQAQILCIR